MAAQQSDNVAHALSGAGGGILSMALTYETLLPSPHFEMLTVEKDILLLLFQRVLKSNQSVLIRDSSML